MDNKPSAGMQPEDWRSIRSDIGVHPTTHYLSQDSPLAVPFKRSADFFTLFGDFQGYVNFFLLHDLVTDDFTAVKFFLPFVDFNDQSPYPNSVDAFRAYLREAMRFIESRNLRILEYVQPPQSNSILCKERQAKLGISCRVTEIVETHWTRSPCRVRNSHPLVSSVGIVKEEAN